MIVNDENVDPYHPFKEFNNINNNSNNGTLRLKRNSSMTPTLRRGNHLDKKISPIKSRPNTLTRSISRPNTSNSMITSTPKKKVTKSKAEIVIIGDSNCGKTRLVTNYIKSNTRLKPLIDEINVFQNHEIDILIRNYQKIINMEIWDFPGDDTFDRVRPKMYITCDFVLICFNFNIDYKSSLNNIRERWIPEVNSHCQKNTIKYIIGIDRKNKNLPNFSYFYKFAKLLDCKYLECSLNDLNSIEKIFNTLATLKANQENDLLLKNSRLNGQSINKSLNNNILLLDNQINNNNNDQIGYRKTSYSRKSHACIIF